MERESHYAFWKSSDLWLGSERVRRGLAVKLSGAFPELQRKENANGWREEGWNREREREEGREGRRADGREGELRQKRGRQHQDIQYFHELDSQSSDPFLIADSSDHKHLPNTHV